jgi:hypothetical protein
MQRVPKYDRVIEMTAPVLTLDYAGALSLNSPQAHRASKLMFVVSILSGLCVGVCFLSFSENLAAQLLHLAIFAMTIVFAVLAGIALSKVDDTPNRRLRVLLDSLAGFGLVVIGVAPLAFRAGMRDDPAPIILGFAYLLLAGSAPRHIMLYRALAAMCRQVDREKIAKAMITLGWFKTIYEGIWLGSCAGALCLANGSSDLCVYLAVVAFVGCLGFAGVWILMMVLHGKFMSVTK